METQDAQVNALATIVGHLSGIESAIAGLQGEDRTEALELTQRRVARTLATYKPERPTRNGRNGKGSKA